MIALTSRAIRIVEALLGRDTPTSSGQLARSLETNERSVRYELDTIGVWLKGRGLVLRRKPRIGVWVEGSAEKRAMALSDLSGNSPACPIVARAEDRAWLILGWVLSTDAPLSLDFLEQVLGISRRTLYYDLAKLQKLTLEHQLKLQLIKGTVFLAGEEVRCREVMVELLERSAATGNLANAVASLRDNRAPSLGRLADPFTGRYIRHLLEQLGDQEAVQKIRLILESSAFSYHLPLEPRTATALTAHILVVLTRARQGHNASADKGQIGRLRQRREWKMASRITKALEKTFTVSLPPSEVSYIALYLLSSGWESADTAAVPRAAAHNRLECGRLARSVIEKVGAYLVVDLAADDELAQGLTAHLQSSLEKIRAGMTIRNALLVEIRQRYPIIHSAVRNATKEVGESTGLRLPEEEAGWIALHIGAALERSARLARRWRGVVVCASGVGVAQMLRARLATEFPGVELRVFGALDADRLWKYAKACRADVIVSTVELGPAPVPVIVVSPFLTDSDAQRITNVVHARAGLDEESLLAACRASPDQLPAAQPTPTSNGPTLRDLLTRDLIAVGLKVSQPAEAIRAAGDLLVGKGIATSSYVGAMVDIYHRLGPYIVVAPGVAIPHASPGDGALGLGMALVTLEKPIAFGSPGSDPVGIVIAFASPDYVSHLRALIDLFHLLEEDLPARLSEVGSVDEVLRRLWEPLVQHH